MKNFFLFTFLIISFLGWSQTDTLVLSTGEVRLVKLISFNENGTIKYELKGEEISLGERGYITFKSGDEWLEFDSENKVYTRSTKRKYPIHTNFFSRPHPGGKPPKWRLQFDLLPLLIETNSTSYETSFISWNSYISTFYYNNRAISLDIGYEIHPMLILHLPMRFGLGANETINIEGRNEYNPLIRYREPRELSDYKADGVSYTPYYRHNQGHNKHLVFEAGLSPKFYPFGQSKNAFYIMQNFAFGIFDFKAIDYYSDYDTTMRVNYDNDTTISWTPNYERAVQRTNQFSGFRYEAGVGLDINILQSFSINIECGVSTLPKNKGTELDNMYFKIIGDEYSLIASELFDPLARQKLYFTSRFQLIYKF